MANIALDLSTACLIQPTLYGTTTGVTTDGAGASVDCVDVVGNVLTAVQVVGVRTGTSPTLNGKMQTSTDGTTWTDITGGAFTQVTTSSQSEAIPVKPTARYVRVTHTVGGTSPVFPTTVTVIGARATAPTNVGGFNNTSAAS